MQELPASSQTAIELGGHACFEEQEASGCRPVTAVHSLLSVALVLSQQSKGMREGEVCQRWPMLPATVPYRPPNCYSPTDLRHNDSSVSYPHPYTCIMASSSAEPSENTVNSSCIFGHP